MFLKEVVFFLRCEIITLYVDIFIDFRINVQKSNAMKIFKISKLKKCDSRSNILRNS